MQKTLLATAILGAIVASTPLARADEFDKKTTITVKENVLIPGRVLPPGKYVMKLANVTANRHVVQIFNEDQNKLEATILAFNNYRLNLTSDTVLQYWETPSGSPPALRAWFFPGDNYGQEFAYPRDMAELLARENNNAKVPSYDSGSTASTTEQLAQLEVRDAAPAEEVERSQPSAVVTQPAPAPQQSAEIAPPAPVVAPVEAPAPAPVPNNTILAQNDQPRSSDAIAEAPPSELPSTASSTPWLIALGVFSLMAAFGLRTAKKA